MSHWNSRNDGSPQVNWWLGFVISVEVSIIISVVVNHQLANYQLTVDKKKRIGNRKSAEIDAAKCTHNVICSPSESTSQSFA